MRTLNRSLGIALSLLFAGSAGAVYKCVDEKGVTRIGDTPPEQCANVVMFEVSTSGTVLRRIDPSLTPDQVKARAEEAERRKEADKVANELRRKDLALLATYSSESEFDTVLARTIEPINGRIKSANDRLAAIEKRQKELDEEMEFYKAGKSKHKKEGQKAAPEAPPMLVGELGRLKHEREVLNKSLAAHDKEIAALRAKFDIDKKRWIALKSGRASQLAPEAPPVAEAKQDVKAPARPEPRPVRKTY
jgi:chromosome segregation ATPase